VTGGVTLCNQCYQVGYRAWHARRKAPLPEYVQATTTARSWHEEGEGRTKRAKKQQGHAIHSSIGNAAMLNGAALGSSSESVDHLFADNGEEEEGAASKRRRTAATTALAAATGTGQSFDVVDVLQTVAGAIGTWGNVADASHCSSSTSVGQREQIDAAAVLPTQTA